MGIDGSSAARRHKASQRGCNRKQQCHAYKNEGVARAFRHSLCGDLIERDAQHDSGNMSRAEVHAGGSKHDAKHIRSSRAQRHANAKFIRSSRAEPKRTTQCALRTKEDAAIHADTRRTGRDPSNTTQTEPRTKRSVVTAPTVQSSTLYHPSIPPFIPLHCT